MPFKKTLIVGIAENELDAEYWKRLNPLLGNRVFLPKDSPAIKKEIADAECLLLKFQPAIGKDIIDAAPSLRYIGALATAFGHIDFAHARTKNVVVSNVPGYSTSSVAEFVFGVLLEHFRELAKGKTQVKEGNYSEAGFNAREIVGKTFGILGLGRIGSRVAAIALAFGADVHYWSRSRKSEIEKKGVSYDDIETLIKKADILSLHVARTKDTERLLNRERINKLKKGAVLIVTAPVEIVDLQTIEERVRSGDIVFITDHADEMKPEDVKRFVQYKNALIYPPIAYISEEARAAKQEIFVSNIENFLKGKPTNVVA